MSAGNVAETVVGSIVKDGYENIVRNTNSVRPAQSCTVVPSKRLTFDPSQKMLRQGVPLRAL